MREDDGDDRERRERRGGERGGQGMGDARGEVDRILRGVVERGGGAIDVRDAVGGRIEARRGGCDAEGRVPALIFARERSVGG